jgi:hypothetical protein
MPSNNIKPVIRSQAHQIRPSLFCILPSFDIFSLNKRFTTQAIVCKLGGASSAQSNPHRSPSGICSACIIVRLL